MGGKKGEELVEEESSVREGSGEGGKGVERVEREGREWRGREGAGEMKEEKSEGEACDGQLVK